MDLPIDPNNNVDQANLSNDYFNNIDQMLRRNEKKQTEGILGEQADRGFLHSGDTFSRIANEVTYPGFQNRARAMMPELDRSAGYAYQDRMTNLGNQRQQIIADDEYKRRIQEISARASIEHQLASLESSLGQSGGFDLGAMFGQIGGSAAGAYAGSQVGRAAGTPSQPSYNSSYINFTPNPSPWAPGYNQPGMIDFHGPTPYGIGPYAPGE